MKINLEKVYDCISWQFLSYTLLDAGIPPHLVDVIMGCVSSISMQVQWNGELSTPFSPSCGLRQGCPLSPYLFVLCMEKLAHGILRAVQDNDWKHLVFGRHGTALTHLFFADDLLLFGQATLEMATAIENVLDAFCISSSMKVSVAKTSMLFSGNTSTGSRWEIRELLGFREVENLGRYLGVPLIHGRVKKTTYAYVVDRMSNKIAEWNAARLSFAGRVTLAQSVLCAMTVYLMQTATIPMSICDDIDDLIRRFVWNGVEERRCLNLVDWEVAMRPKKLGGWAYLDLGWLILHSL